jgi:hypothetical protein
MEVLTLKTTDTIQPTVKPHYLGNTALTYNIHCYAFRKPRKFNKISSKKHKNYIPKLPYGLEKHDNKTLYSSEVF